MRFLVIDQSATMRRIVVNSLHRIGFDDVVEAIDGRQALRIFDASCAFVIADWAAPEVAGDGFVRTVRARSVGATVPILMVTTRKARKEVPAAIEAGVSDAIVKPFTPRLLKEKIEVLSTPSLRAIS
jgi:two-component system chemotaxis response regulator CheY